MLVLSPWLFGTTQPPVITGMNAGGYLLWGLLAMKWGIKCCRSYQPATWTKASNRRLDVLGRFLLAVTVAVLACILVSAVNARAVWNPETQDFTYRNFVVWLPHSYDQPRTWRVFTNYVALAGVFWATWDWLRGQTEAEERAGRSQFVGDASVAAALPARLRTLLWVLCVNGGVLALEAILQRQSGTVKLLWLMETHFNQQALSQFGPYAYRANGAQYLNLLWPVCLGFWWTLHRSAGFKHGKHHVLLLCGAIMAVGPFISTARGGAIVAAGMMVAACLFLGGLHFLFPDRSRRASAPATTALLLAVFFGGAGLAAWQIGGAVLEQRMTELDAGMDNREQIYATARNVARDFHWFGTGPGTLPAVFPLYRQSADEFTPVQLHNDWLETRITFGWIGLGLILLALLAVLLRWWIPGGIHGGRRLVGLCWLSLAGALVQARYDFPFQIYSILMLALVLCAILFNLSRRGGA